MSDVRLHMAVIPDGNRRWAKAKSLKPWKGHEAAQDILEMAMDWARDSKKISVITFWLFSTENWKRDPDEISMLMNMLEKTLRKERQKFQKEKTRFVHSGRKDRIPKSLASLIKEIEEETKAFTEFTIQLALDYGGKDEIVRAVNTLTSGKLDESDIAAALDHPELPPIDLILRTSGEKRTSNFFLWQSVYAEWIFPEKFFPDLTKDDLDAALKEFNGRTRRFGGD